MAHGGAKRRKSPKPNENKKYSTSPFAAPAHNFERPHFQKKQIRKEKPSEPVGFYTRSAASVKDTENDEKDEKTGFNRINELEKFQKSVKRRHSRMKKRLIGGGKQKNTLPFTKKPSYKRGKSAPPGFGGA